VKFGGLNAAAREIEVLFNLGPVHGLPDGELLERFLVNREEVVFEALVHRHASMVWGVCRRVLRDHHDAEDAFQAMSLVLARKAASVVPREKVGPWLHGVAYQTALKARATRARRRTRETPVPELPEAQAVREGDRDDWLPRLDREVGRLPEKYRIPIVLCELEGRTLREAADQLGWPIGTVSGRLSRARAILASRLSRPGLADSTGSLGLWIASKTPMATVPTRLIAPTVKAASLSLAGKTVAVGVVSAESVTLMRGVLKTMLLTKIKTVAAPLLLSLTLAAGGTGLAYRAGAADPPGEGNAAPKTENQARDPLAESPRAEVAVAEPEPPAPPDQPVDPMTSYPFRLDPSEVREFAELNVEYRDIRLTTTGPVAVAPIFSERGITGALVVGNGTFRYSPTKDKTIEGAFRAVMLRFNPGEQAAILPLTKGKKVTDQGLTELSRHLLTVVIRHCYQSSKEGGRRQEVLIPPKGALAVVLYSKDHGDLLISVDDKTATAFSFTDRKVLYEKK